ncbi:PleD family two-component system response regulator [Agaribacterium sp. ZY112]|uniref:response regulator n=1 Tax=Agaribacterium sp. ZY112 TaxID=3233574 RepID=UPI0035231A0F
MPCVLIVDDSKTAQARLKGLLKGYDLHIDIAFSAEEALGYLSYNRPDVIFLDHHMEGMDGLEALRIIKNNPATAMIPVVMYTSQKGDVYLGQARALGALDILSKEIIKPANIERVLKNLKIDQKKADAEANSAANGTSTPNSGADFVERRAGGATPTIEEIRAQVARLFELHIADVRQQISDNSRFIVRNLRSEINKKTQSPKKAANEPVSEPELDIIAPVESEPAKTPLALVAALVCACVLLVANIVNERSQAQQQIAALNEAYNVLDKRSQATQQALTVLANSVNESKLVEQSTDLRFSELMDAMSWAISTDLSFAFEESPLSEAQVGKIEELIRRLSNAGFQGELALDFHFGDACVEFNDSEIKLASEDKHYSDCLLLSTLNYERPAANYISDAYIEMEQSVPALFNNDIRLSLMSSGIESLASTDSIITAGQWNQQALRHNRVHLELIPD